MNDNTPTILGPLYVMSAESALADSEIQAAIDDKAREPRVIAVSPEGFEAILGMVNQ